MIPKGKVAKNDQGLSNIDYDGRRVAVIAAVSIRIPAGKAADVGKVLILVHSAGVQQNADQTGIAQHCHRTEQHSTAQRSTAHSTTSRNCLHRLPAITAQEQKEGQVALVSKLHIRRRETTN